MSRRSIVMGLCVGFSLLLAASAPRADQAAEQEAVRAAEAWLALVDRGDYAASWDAAAALFRAATTKAQWEQALNAARRPLGRLGSRTLRSTRYATSLPGAPDGEYVVIQYQASFEQKRSAIETVTPMRERDGTWRVSGYFIR